MEWRQGENMIKYAKKVVTHVVVVIFMAQTWKKPFQNFFNLHYQVMVHSIEFRVSYT